MSNLSAMPQMGWICPKCQLSLAPWMPSCFKCNVDEKPEEINPDFPYAPTGETFCEVRIGTDPKKVIWRGKHKSN